MCIAIVCFPGFDVINFEISLQPKSQDKNSNILRTKRAFQVKQKAFFIIFAFLSFAKYCLRPESASLRIKIKIKNQKPIQKLNQKSTSKLKNLVISKSYLKLCRI